MGRAGVQALVALLFFVSGTCSLVYQIAWVRMLVPTFGMSVFAVSTVLTAFMAGLALGSAWFGRIVDRTGRGLRIYGWLEAGIGLFALALPLLLGWTNDLYGPLYRATGESRFLFFSLRFVLVFLVLLVPTTLMGGTLPVLSRWAVRSFSRVGWNVGRLYAVNTFGAAFGCFLAAFVLMERLGVRGTSYLAAAGNLLIALAAFTLSRFWTEADAGADPRTEPMDGAPALARTLPRYATRFVFWGFAASGFAALGYEVVWTRLLSVILRLTTTQSLSVILVVFLFGLAAGGVVGAWWVDRWRRPFLAFGVLELLLGLFGLGSIAAFGTIPGILDRLGGLASWQGHMLRLLVASFAVMLVPTFLMGVLFPVAAKIHALELKTLGRRVGGIYAINTGGAILGAFVTGFVLIPTFGTQGTIQALAAVNLALGAGALLLNPSGRMRSVATLATFTLPVVVLAFVPSSSFLVGLFSSADGEVIYYDEDTAGTVTVQEYGDGLRVLRVNGAGEVPTDRDSLRTFRLLGNLPMMLHPDPQDVLVVAFGGGITLASAEMQRPARIEVVEIVPGVVDAAPLFSAHNNEVFTRLGTDALQLIEDDGRNHLLRSDREYDVIIVDSTHPGTSDSWVLYTEEFYRLCRGRLKPGGVVAPWLPIHGLTADDYKTIVRTFRVVFPHSSIWLTPGYSVLFGSIDPLRIDYRQVASRLEDPAVRAGLEEVDLGDPASFLSSMALDSDAMFRYLEEGVINTDDKPCISLGDRLRAGTGGGLPVLLSLVPFAYQHGHGAVAGATETEVEELNRRVRARRHGFLSGVASQMGDRDRAVEQARRAVALDAREYEAQRILGTEGRRP
jgi:spermidine synthase